MNQENPNAEILSIADAYCVATGVKDSTLSSRLFNDGKKLGQLRLGKTITSKRLGEAMRWFSANWPPGGKWPKAVSRPKVTAAPTPELQDAK